jgi:hypothetical protein
MKTWVVLAGLLLSVNLFAQTYVDEGLLFSQTGTPGTARTLGAGNAFGSVGADLGSLNINPAGIGLYRSTDMSITPALSVTNNEANFNSSVKNQKNTKVSLNQAGIVFTKLFAQKSSSEYSFNRTTLNSFSFAVNYQRQNAFARKVSFEGYNPNNSAMDLYAYYLNSTRLPLTTDNYPVEMLMAYQAYLLDYDSATGNYYSTIPSKVLQSGYINRRGAIDQVDFTLGGNISDKFYFGAGLGVAIVTYSDDSYFDEYPYKDTATMWNGYTFQTNLRSTGVGVNARFGFIYRPTSWMRFGVAYQMPTFYSLTENYYATLSAGYDTVNYNYSAEAQPLPYKFRSPMKGTVSTSFYIKQHALISVDYEFLNNGAGKYNFGSSYSDFSSLINSNMVGAYTFTHNLRFGVEGAFKTLRVRAGYNYTSTPFKKDQITKGYTQDKHSASFGLGYRGQRFYADAAYVFGISKDAMYPYANFEVKNTLISHSVMLTLGWKINREARTAKSKPARQAEPIDRSY